MTRQSVYDTFMTRLAKRVDLSSQWVTRKPELPSLSEEVVRPPQFSILIIFLNFSNSMDYFIAFCLLQLVFNNFLKLQELFNTFISFFFLFLMHCLKKLF